jgi:hypothetical protein
VKDHAKLIGDISIARPGAFRKPGQFLSAVSPETRKAIVEAVNSGHAPALWFLKELIG